MSLARKILSANTDQELILDYRDSGNLEVLGELYQRYMDLVYGVSLKYFKQQEDAKDSVLNIFEELVTKLRKHQVENFKSWLYQVTKNHCLGKLRSRKIIPVNIELTTMQFLENDHLDDVHRKEENFQCMEYCLTKLEPQQRQVIEMFYKMDKCYREIADETGLEAGKVRSYLQNGRRNLRICMEKQMNKQLK